MKKSELRQLIKEEISKMQEQDQASNQYVKWDEDEKIYVLDDISAEEYLKQFIKKGHISPSNIKRFMSDEEGFFGEDLWLENPEKMSNEEIEEQLKQALSFYLFSDADSIV